MKIFLLLPVFFLFTGCAIRTVPVTVSFPEAPELLRQECSKLKEATENMTLSEYTRTVVDNYMKYHECSAKVKGWNDWHTEQKKIFEEATNKR